VGEGGEGIFGQFPGASPSMLGGGEGIFGQFPGASPSMLGGGEGIFGQFPGRPLSHSVGEGVGG